ncbi:hypothetical protein Q7P37_001165 [Cladosporium fusiforme]
MTNVYLVKFTGIGKAILRLLNKRETRHGEGVASVGGFCSQSTTQAGDEDGQPPKAQDADSDQFVDAFSALALGPVVEKIPDSGSDDGQSLQDSSDDDGVVDIFSKLDLSPHVDELLDVFGGLTLAPIEPKRKIHKYRGKHTPKRADMRILLTGPTKFDYSVQLYSRGSTSPSIEFPVLKRSPNKTVAVLRGARNDNLIASVSGWSEEFGSSHAYILDNLVWAEKAIALCKATGHVLQADWRDGDIPGRYNACHAEKQLLAYVFENQRRRFGSSSLANNIVIEMSSVSTLVAYHDGLVLISQDESFPSMCWYSLSVHYNADITHMRPFVRHAPHVVNHDVANGSGKKSHPSASRKVKIIPNFHAAPIFGWGNVLSLT